MIDENLQRYILSFLNLCSKCKKYHIVIYKYTCYNCKKIMCSACSKENMIYGMDNNESICRYCLRCYRN